MQLRSTEARFPGAERLHSAPAPDILNLLHKGQAGALAAVAVAKPRITEAAVAALRVLKQGGKLGYAGAGSAGLMAMSDCLELAGTFGIAPARTPMLFAGGAAALLNMSGAVEDDTDAAREDVVRAGLGTGDAVICVSASGTTPYTVAVAEAAQTAGATTIAIANVGGSGLLKSADHPVFLDTGAEVIAGSTRLGAATAQKVALNMISVLIGIGLGHVHGGYMVNLVADNAKLADRAERIVAAIAEVSKDAAAEALARADGALKPAILIATGSSAHEARNMLAEADGHLAVAFAARETRNGRQAQKTGSEP